MKKIVFAWGRMNPVTIGHEKLVDKVRAVAKRERAEPRIYLSHTQSAKKDPLQYKDKVAAVKKAFGPIVKQSASKTLIQLLQELEKAGFTEVALVAGSDRVNEYKTLLNKYNGKDYSFDKIKVISAGQRDADAEGVEGMSASKLRKLATDGKFDDYVDDSGKKQPGFKSGLPKKLQGADAMKLYRLVRKGLLVEEMSKFLEEAKKKIDVDKIDFSDSELDKAVSDMMKEEEFDEEWDIEEELDDLQERAPLTLQQRIKKARQMKRLAPKLKRMRQVKKFRMAPTERLVMRARKLARNLIRKKFAGLKGQNYAQLAPSEKITVDKLIANKTSVIEKLAKRLLPKIRKAEIERIRQARKAKTESIERYDDVFEALFEATKTRQDPDIKDREGTQPARYHSGLSPSTKAARDAQFKKQTKMASDNPKAYKPAPGDKTAETKPSKWTKRYKDMFGETNEDATKAARELINKEKEQDKIKHDRMMDRARLRDAQSVVRKARSINRNTSPTSVTNEDVVLTEKSMEALKKKAEKSGYSYGTLKKVYNRGVAAWRTGHRPGTTPEQWGYARVNAFIAKQKSGQKLNHDQDLA